MVFCMMGGLQSKHQNIMCDMLFSFIPSHYQLPVELIWNINLLISENVLAIVVGKHNEKILHHQPVLFIFCLHGRKR